jgi:hypothetical protein
MRDTSLHSLDLMLTAYLYSQYLIHITSLYSLHYKPALTVLVFVFVCMMLTAGLYPLYLMRNTKVRKGAADELRQQAVDNASMERQASRE